MEKTVTKNEQNEQNETNNCNSDVNNCTPTAETSQKNNESVEHIDKKKRTAKEKEPYEPYTRTTTPTERARALFLRTYQRPGETYQDVMQRVEKHLIWQYQKGTKRTQLTKEQQNEIREVMQLIVDGKVCCAGRTLWLGGTSLIENPNEPVTTQKKKKRECSQFNCSFLECRTAKDLRQIFHLLLQGCGVGTTMINGTIYGFKNKIQKIEVLRSELTEKTGKDDTKEYFEPNGVWRIEIGDSSDAWSDALERLVRCKVPNGFKINKLVIDCRQIRPSGTVLGSYGWVSMGDVKIAHGFTKIAEILNNKVDMILSKIDIYDIVNHLGTILSTRRSAIICLMDADDPEWEAFASAKDRYWEVGNHHRSQSNNSLVFKTKPSREHLQKIFKIMADSGGSEPGFINGEAAKKRAPYYRGVNPCGEILLPDKGFCNLSEINLLAFQNDMPGLHRAIELVARMNYRQSIVNLDDGILDNSWTDNNDFLHLCGVSCTGIAARDDLTEYDWQRMREIACNSARLQAIEFGMSPSKNVTCVKPSGCCAPETLISTNRGLLRLDEIGNINGEKWQPISDLYVSQESEFKPVSKFYVNDHNFVRVLKFKSGFTFTCTPNHQLRVWDGKEYKWVHTKDLVVNQSVLPYRLGFFTPVNQATDDIYAITNELKFTDIIPDINDDTDVANKKFNSSNFVTGFLFWLMGAYTHQRAFEDKESFEFQIYAKLDNKELEVAKKLLVHYFKHTKNIKDVTDKYKEHVGKPIISVKGQGIMTFMQKSTVKLTDNSPFFPDFIRSSSPNAMIAYLYGSQGIGFSEFLEFDKVDYNIQSLLNQLETNTSGTSYSESQSRLVLLKERYANEVLAVLRALGIDTVILPDEFSVKFKLHQVKSDMVVIPELKSLFGDKYGLDTLVSMTETTMDTFDLEVPENNCYVAGAGIISHNTLSKCFGTVEWGEVPEGIHKPLGQYIFNNVNFNKLDPMVQKYREAGYKIIPHPFPTEADTTVLITLPVKYSSALKFTPVKVNRNGKEEVVNVNIETAIVQLDRYEKINTNWTNHNTSCTISYSPDEVENMIDWFMTHWDSYVGVSFIYRNNPTLTAKDLSYAYLPQEVKTESEYIEYVSGIKPISIDFELKQTEEHQSDLIQECDGGSCPVR